MDKIQFILVQNNKQEKREGFLVGIDRKLSKYINLNNSQSRGVIYG